MPTTKHSESQRLPGRFEDLVQLMPPQAIVDDVHHKNTVAVIDRLMATGKLTKGQSLYLETLVQLVAAYEALHHAIDTSNFSAIGMLRHLMGERQMNASSLARVLGAHVSLGSKILKGERALTIEHVKKLAAYFRVRPELFLDAGSVENRQPSGP